MATFTCKKCGHTEQQSAGVSGVWHECPKASDYAKRNHNGLVELVREPEPVNRIFEFVSAFDTFDQTPKKWLPNTVLECDNTY